MRRFKGEDMEMERGSRLVVLCIEEACKSRESVERWRRQRRSLERMPSHLADALLRRLLRRRLLFPSLLEVFKHSVEDIDLRGESSVDAEWIAYIGGFSNLRSLSLSGCQRIDSSALWPISGMTSLKELDLSRCSKVTDADVRHLLSIPTLEKLWISETGVTQGGVLLLASLENLSLLDLGGLPVTDGTLKSLQVLTKLEYLDLWGSDLTDRGTCVLFNFPSLSYLNLSWTSVTNIPNMSSLECLCLSNCTINSIFEAGGGIRPSLRKLELSGATLESETEAFVFIDTYFLTSLNASNSSLQSFGFLEKMKMLEHLDLSSTALVDDSIEFVACIGENLRSLNLSNTRISSAGVGTLAGHVPQLESLSLSQTAVDDVAISYISMMPSIKVLDLSNTNVRGFIYQVGSESEAVPPLASLQALKHLERLNLEQTQLQDSALCALSSFKELTHLSLGSPLTDAALHQFSSLPKLASLGIHDAVLTNQGLDSFRPQPSLKILDLRGCWLLTEDAIASVSKRHLGIEVRHEFTPTSPNDQNTHHRPSPLRMRLKASCGNKKQQPLPISQCFLDQRLKYSREELLDLQSSPDSLALVQDGSINLPEELTE